MNAGRRTPPIVSRDYRPGPDHCARALELLLRKPTIKKAAEPRKPDVPNDAESHRSGHAGVGGAR